MFVCRAKGLLEKWFGVVVPWCSTKLVLGFVFSHGSGTLKSFRLSLPQTLVMYSPGKGSGKFQESASGNMEAGMAGQATGSCQGQQGTGSGSNTLDPWGDYLQRQQFVQQTLNQGGGPRIPSTPTNGSRGGSSSPSPHQGGFWNQGLVTQPGRVGEEGDHGAGTSRAGALAHLPCCHTKGIPFALAWRTEGRGGSFFFPPPISCRGYVLLPLTALNGRPRAGATCGEDGVGNSEREILAH